MRRVMETMGTVASIDLPDEHSGLLAAITAVFRETDERFSLYRPDSELARIAARSLDLAHSSNSVRSSYERANEWRILTGGLFTAERPDGVLDLNGIVKAEAIEQAGALLDRAGCARWSINLGGDILVRSDREEGWTVGVADPDDASDLLCTVQLGDPLRALATSGSAQRGDHIWAAGVLGPADFVQVSVLATDIVTADVLATAIVAGGRDALDDLSDRWPVEVLTMDRERGLLATPGFGTLSGLKRA